MNYGHKTPSTYRSNPSVYSHGTGRSSSNLHSIKSRSLKSVRIPWYQKPILHNNEHIDIQKGALLTGLFAICVAIFTIGTSIFDVYCLAMAAPGSTHYGYYVISYEFVYVGSVHVRNALVIFALFSLIGGIVVLVTSVLLVVALRKEYEQKTKPWLWTYAVFISFRLLAFLFFAIVNDLIFAYNILMVLTWLAIIAASVYGWLLVYSLYIELTNLTRLEDLAHLRMGTMQSLHASTTQSLTSRPTTPHSTISTMPVGKEV
uniref:Putative conserved plasma membrane protein n=1 Tax=Tabanus bromius TaxID=304241 RepID=A0A0K8TPZ5_TABBR